MKLLRQRSRGRHHRRGFSLLELLVVISIIATLASLMLGSLFKVYDAQDRLSTTSEIMAMESAIKAFAADVRFGQTGYIPSQLDPSGTDWRSAAYLRKIFTKSDGQTPLPSMMLDGHEVFVLILGGPNNGGWSTDPQNPASTSGQRVRFFDFDKKRMKVTRTGSGADGVSYSIYQYVDKWGTPYAYFSPKRESKTWDPPNYTDDCATCLDSLGKFPKAYQSQNLTGFQIISAGKDRRFGVSGDVWNPKGATGLYPPGNPGHDDQANFGTRQLGAAQ